MFLKKFGQFQDKYGMGPVQAGTEYTRLKGVKRAQAFEGYAKAHGISEPRYQDYLDYLAHAKAEAELA